MKDREKLFSEAEVRNWCFQVFQGLAYMHQRGYFHRDLKPGNCLCWWSNLIGRRETKHISEISVEKHKYPLGFAFFPNNKLLFMKNINTL